jgi:uncharacterized protein YceH (UPF0502 family)
MVDVPEVMELTAAQARVLGSLLEKQMTTPDAYPLTLNALTTACNQTTNRDPVVRYDSTQVETTLMALKGKGLTRVVHPGSGERATKYRHVLDEAVRLDSAEQALICVLLLRGAQTVPELKTRTERLHPFASTREVETALQQMSTREPALVARIDQAAGQREPRWIQLLESGADRRAAVPTPASVAPTSRGSRVEELEDRVAELESRIAALTDALGDLITPSDPG